MKIYVDLLFFINVFFDFILLLSVSLILRRSVKIIRLIFGALVGGISIVFLFYNINSLQLFFLKIIIAILMCLVTFKFIDIKYFIKNILYLYLVSIVLGGFLYFLNIEFSYKNNGLIFYHEGLGINLIFIIVVTPIIMFFYVNEQKKLKNIYSKYYKVEIIFKNDKKILLNGYLDTGNNLKDPYKNRPIVLVEYEKIKKYIEGSKELLVPYHVLNRSDILRCIKVNKLIINNKEYFNILIGLSFNKFFIDGINCILNNNMEGI